MSTDTNLAGFASEPAVAMVSTKTGYAPQSRLGVTGILLIINTLLSLINFFFGRTK